MKKVTIFFCFILGLVSLFRTINVNAQSCSCGGSFGSCTVISNTCTSLSGYKAQCKAASAGPQCNGGPNQCDCVPDTINAPCNSITAGCCPGNPQTGQQAFCIGGLTCNPSTEKCDGGVFTACNNPGDPCCPSGSTGRCNNGWSCIGGAVSGKCNIANADKCGFSCNPTTQLCSFSVSTGSWSCSDKTSSVTSATTQFCDPVSGEPLAGSDPNAKGIRTAFGCLDITGANTIRALLGWSIGIAGGIAFLSIVYAGFLIVTSQGDPKKSQSGKEMITSSIAGLFLILAAVVVLNFIGLNILGLGNLGFDV